MTPQQRKDRARQLLEDLRPFNAEFALGDDDRFVVIHDRDLPPDLEQRLDEAIEDIEMLCVNIEFEKLMREGRGPN